MDTTEPKATFLGEGSSDLEGRGSLYPARGDGARLSKPGVKVAFSLIFPNPKCVFPGVQSSWNPGASEWLPRIQALSPRAGAPCVADTPGREARALARTRS